MIAHQRAIRETMVAAHPHEAAQRLDGYSVETISRADATPIIMHYEWLRTIGRATLFVGLISARREIEGVACFGWGPQGPIRTLIGKPALCLERGACVHYAPRNAASFLINSACKLIFRITGTARFFAYGDPMAGEYGGVYQAAGWVYLGQGLDGGPGRRTRYRVLAPGLDPNIVTNWKSTRELRREHMMVWDEAKRKWRGTTFAEARAEGWEIAARPGKHVYATNVGRDRRKWRKSLHCLTYPAPYPALKRKYQEAAPAFTIPVPPMEQPDFLGDFGQISSK